MNEALLALLDRLVPQRRRLELAAAAAQLRADRVLELVVPRLVVEALHLGDGGLHLGRPPPGRWNVTDRLEAHHEAEGRVGVGRAGGHCERIEQRHVDRPRHGRDVRRQQRRNGDVDRHERALDRTHGAQRLRPRPAEIDAGHQLLRYTGDCSEDLSTEVVGPFVQRVLDVGGGVELLGP